MCGEVVAVPVLADNPPADGRIASRGRRDVSEGGVGKIEVCVAVRAAIIHPDNHLLEVVLVGDADLRAHREIRMSSGPAVGRHCLAVSGTLAVEAIAYAVMGGDATSEASY